MDTQTALNIPREIISSWPLVLGRMPYLAFKLLPESLWHTPGTKNPVLLIHGLGATPVSLWFIEVGLKRAGYTVYLADIGQNIGSFEQQGQVLIDQVEKISKKHSLPVDVIGWSMGGRYANRLAELIPDKIGKILTYASPIINNDIPEAYEKVWRAGLSLIGIDPEAVKAELSNPIKLPTRQNALSSIVTQYDAVVPVKNMLIPSTMTRKNSLRENIFVPTGHIGIGFSMAVLAIAINRLSEHRATWTRYSPS